MNNHIYSLIFLVNHIKNCHVLVTCFVVKCHAHIFLFLIDFLERAFVIGLQSLHSVPLHFGPKMFLWIANIGSLPNVSYAFVAFIMYYDHYVP